MKKKITLKDIARELDVSISTVSKALKNSVEISRDTREKIQAFAKLYNYKPNNIAVSLKNRRTRNIGVIIPDIVHHFFTTVIRGIEQYANQRGYNVLVCVSGESFQKEVINMELLANGSIDGFIMALSAETQQKNDFKHLEEVVDQGIPLVLFDRVTDEIICDKVINDDTMAAKKATEKLIDQGRTKIALVTTEDYLSVSAKRKTGYMEALRRKGLPVNDSLVLQLPYDRESPEKFLEFFRNNEVDGVLSVNEIFALQTMRTIHELGYSIPEDIAVVGFTDGMLSKLANPPLSAVAQHGDKMGERAAALLIDKIEAPPDKNLMYTTEVIEATLVERASTGNKQII